MRRHKVLMLAGGLTLAFAALLVVSRLVGPSLTDAQRVQRAKYELAQGNWSVAVQLASEVTERSRREEALFIQAAAVQQQAGQVEALNHLLNATPPGKRSTAMQIRIAELAAASGAISEALRATEAILAVEPNNSEALRRSALLNGIAGRRWESRKAYWQLLKLGTISVNELAIYADIERPIDAGAALQDAATNNRTDRLVRLGLTTWNSDFATEADDSIETLARENPAELAAQVLWGTALVHQDTDEFLSWNEQLPQTAESYAPIWSLRGDWFRRRAQMRLAAKCYWKALSIDPVYRTATYELGKALQFLDHPSAQNVIEKAELMFEMAEHLDVILNTGGRDESAMQGVTQIALKLGRVWEATAWAVLSKRLFADRSWPDDLRERAVARLAVDTPRVIPEDNPAVNVDLGDWGDIQAELRRPTSGLGPIQTQQHNIRFVEADVVQFEYRNGANPATPGARMFEITGGGVAVIDYDLDGWPDMFFSQGGDWPEGRQQPPAKFSLNDELHRNRRGLRFENVSDVAGMHPGGFGQGATVTDLNADGFPDLIVANVGRNQVLENMGDGTFIDVSDRSGISDAAWTTSVAAGDLNHDGLPDLYFVNYVNADDVFTRICQQRACSPLVFDGSPDRVYLNSGDGSFAEVTSGLPQSGSKGLGVVICSVGDDDGLDVFVANDQVPNFYLSAQPEQWSNAAEQFQLVENGLTSGLAYSEDGLAMACMGIAATDLNHDGRLDFHVTNFRNEPNTLYRQEAAELFVDATRASGLRTPSLPFVGWGTQFLDADNDGDSDLVVANGHTDEFPKEEGGYAMPTLLFGNLGKADFELLSPDQCGEFFEQPLVGRGLATLDWNWDGKSDFVVCTLHSLARLVENETDAGSWIQVELVCSEGIREHVGDSVLVESEGRKQTQQLMSGNGYMASNQRLLHFGLGSAQEVSRLSIDWGSGRVVTHQNVAPNRRYRAVDDRLYQIVQ